MIARTSAARLALIACALGAALLAGRPLTALADPGSATIAYVDGAQQVYLDRGATEGLTPGMIVHAQRQGKAVATLELTAVSDGRSAARIVSADRQPRAGDAVLFDAAPRPPAAAPEPPQPRPAEIDPTDRPAAWRGALIAQERPLIDYAGSDAARPARLHARAETEFVSHAYFGAPQLQRNQQRISLWSKGEDIGTPGLDLRVRGEVNLRYGGGPYRYQTDQIAVIQLREVALTYDTPTGIGATAGRFKPDARLAGVLDGAQLAWGRERLALSAFGGLRPTLTDLRPQADVPAYGVSATLRAEPQSGTDWRVAVGYVGEIGDALRQSIALDSDLRREDRWLREQATLRLPNGADAGGVSLVALQGHSPIGDGLSLDASARYIDQPLYVDDVSPQTTDWLEPLQSRSLARADVGLTLPRGELTRWKPYAYWHHQRLSDAPDVLVAAAGLSWRRQKILGTHLSLDVSGDYGDGTRQQARLAVTARGAPTGHLVTALVVADQWTYGHATGLHTFQHLAHASLTYAGALPLDLWVGAQGSLDHGAYIQKALGTWASGQLGVRYAW